MVLSLDSVQNKKKKSPLIGNQACLLCCISFFWAKKVGVRLTKSGGETRLFQKNFQFL